MKKLLNVAFIVTLLFCALPTGVHAAILLPTNTLPKVLPIGNRQRMIDWAVTNRNCTLGITMYMTNDVGYWVYGGNLPVVLSSRFDSYESFKRCSASNAVKLYMYLTTNFGVIQPYSLRYQVSLLYGSTAGILINTNFSTPLPWTSNLFYNTDPVVVQSCISVTNLRYFNVQVNLTNGGLYQYTWLPGMGETRIPPYPYERTVADMVSLSEWYSTNASRVRFSIGDLAYTNEYTQSGELLNKPLTISRSDQSVSITFARGADVSMESAPSPAGPWHQVATIPWSWGSNSIRLPCIPSQPSQFFRATTQ